MKRMALHRRPATSGNCKVAVGGAIAFVAAMTYDRIVHAIGPFELSEYVGLALIYGALAAAISAPLHRDDNIPAARQLRARDA